MGYNELLKDEKWKSFSSQVILRDGYKCQKCNKFGFRSDLYIPISSLENALNIFDNCLFDGKSLREIINIPVSFNNVYHFNQSSILDNLHSPSITAESDGSYIGKVCTLGDILLYNEKPIIKEVPFNYKMFSIKEMTNENNNVLYKHIFIRVAHFPLSSDAKNGYINLTTGKTHNDYSDDILNIITNEYFISIDICRFFNISPTESIEKESFFTRLNVHHTFYKYNNSVPWDYNTDDLITLCEKCHLHLHNTENIPIINEYYTDISASLQTCDRCSGKGIISEYKHVEGGICFKCRGTKKILY